MDLQILKLALQSWAVDGDTVLHDSSGRGVHTDTQKGKALLSFAYNNFLLDGDWHFGEKDAISGISNGRLSASGRGLLAALTRASAVEGPESFPAVFKRSFQSGADYAEFAISKAAPRYSVRLVVADDIGGMLGLKDGEALFSDDMNVLKRAAINWDANGFEVFIDLAVNYPEYYPDVDDCWWVRANSSVPTWFLEECSTSGRDWPALNAPIAEVEAVILDMLVGENYEIFAFMDREDCLQSVVSDIALDDDCQPRNFDIIANG